MKHRDLTLNLCNYMDYLKNQKSCSEHTIRAYKTDFNQAFGLNEVGNWKISQKTKTNFIYFDVDKEVHEIDLKDLSKEALSHWRDYTAKTKNRKIAALKGFFGWMYDQDLCDIDYGQSLILPKVPQKIPHHISVDEALSLFRTIENDIKNSETEEKRQTLLKEQLILLLLYGAGLRVSEACQILWKDLSSDLSSVRILGKGNKQRIVSFPQLIAKSLKQLDKTGPYLFGDKPINSRTAYSIVKKWGINAGLLKPLHPHALRHSYATHMLNSGVNLRTLQTLLGHSTLSATEKYLHLGVDELARTLEAHHPIAKNKYSQK